MYNRHSHFPGPSLPVLTLMAGLVLASVGCAGKKKPDPSPSRPDQELPAAETAAEPPGSLTSEEKLEYALRQIETLKSQLQAKEVEQASLEERYMALEIELASTVEEVLRSKASLRGVQSRALATSRIAELRVELRSAGQTEDAEALERVRRAKEFLDRADEALAEGNYGGAVYLAERASELTRQARLVREFRSAGSSLAQRAIPIVPPRPLEATVAANLRQGPGTDTPRVGVLAKGEQVMAVARLGDWFQAETATGEKAWVHRSVVR